MQSRRVQEDGCPARAIRFETRVPSHSSGCHAKGSIPLCRDWEMVDMVDTSQLRPTFVVNL